MRSGNATTDALPGYPVVLRDEFEEYLRGVRFSADLACAGLVEAIRYSVFAGGKRIRPVLALSTARLLGVAHRQVLPLAAALELIHTFSLVHDDLPAMDDDDLRRGRPTNHIVFGEWVAILAGDGLFAEAFRLLLRLDWEPAGTVRAARVIADAMGTGGLAGGQYIDVAGTARDEDAVLHMHRLKTGRLLEASVCSVLELAAPPQEIATPLRRYAAELGAMFQIVDDVLDVAGSVEETGKRGRSDQRNLRRTLVVEGHTGPALRLADACFSRIHDALALVPGDTTELSGIARLVRDRVA